MTHRSPEQWAQVSADAVVAGSAAQARNVLQMALDDIASLAGALSKLTTQVEAEFTVDGKWSHQGQLVTEHAYKRARAALSRAQASEQSGG